MKDLSIFVDESGDFGAYDARSPYYIVSLVFHDQSVDVGEEIARYDRSLDLLGYPNHTVHAGPLIRREEVYVHMSIDERKKIFNRAFHFFRVIDVTYKSFVVEKKHISSGLELISVLSKQLSRFFQENVEFFAGYDRVILYYDNGQVELTKILIAVLHAFCSNIEHRQAKPAEYRLLQAADIVCTLMLTELKAETSQLSGSERAFFVSGRELKKNYLKVLKRKEFGT